MTTANGEWLWYTCTVCGNTRSTSWDLGPQQRERRVVCFGDGACNHKRTLHRLAGLGPISRYDDCPSWCTDHRTWRNGTQEHLCLLVTWQGWHEYLERWDCTTLEISQLVDRPDVQNKAQTQPNINFLLSIASPEKSRIGHALLGQALALLDTEQPSSAARLAP